MTEKTAVYQDDKLIGYCDRVSLRTELQSFGEPDENCYRITGFVPIDHQPAFAVGEYYASKTGIVFMISSKTTKKEIAAVKSLVDGELIDGMIDTTEIMFRNSKPATAEQIATFQRAEHFASKGRKLDEFRVGDLVLIGRDKVCVKNISPDEWITAINKNGGYKMRKNDSHRITLIQTAEELQEVEGNE